MHADINDGIGRHAEELSLRAGDNAFSDLAIAGGPGFLWFITNHAPIRVSMADPDARQNNSPLTCRD